MHFLSVNYKRKVDPTTDVDAGNTLVILSVFTEYFNDLKFNMLYGSIIHRHTLCIRVQCLM